MNNLEWQCLSFEELDNTQLYEIMKLRSVVFVVEQDCVYLDLDDKDQQAVHVMGYSDNQLAAYTRLLAPGIKYPGASIGRVVTHPDQRGNGSGRQLMQYSLTACAERWPDADITISAQKYLEAFYQSLGFQTVSEPYMEDDIPHIEMLRPATTD